MNCGCSITSEVKIKKSGLVFIYYSCTNSKGTAKQHVPEKELLKPIYDVLDRFESFTEGPPPEHQLREGTEAEVAFHKAQENRIRTQYE